MSAPDNVKVGEEVKDAHMEAFLMNGCNSEFMVKNHWIEKTDGKPDHHLLEKIDTYVSLPGDTEMGGRKR